MTAHFSPISQTNRRTARCQRCRASLPAGAGQGWQFQADSLVNSPVMYLCTSCSDARSVEERALVQSHQALQTIGHALGFSRPLGFINEDRVKRAIRAAGSRAPLIAQEIAGRIEAGESFTVWDIVQLMQEEL